MLFWTVAVLFSWILDLLAILRLADSDKDLELLILRQQIAILERNTDRPRLSRFEKLTLAVLIHKFKQRAGITCRRLAESVFIFTPETILRWHRELVKRKWTFKRRRQSGRPRIDPDIEALIVRLARENPRWGYGKIEGELFKLGHDVGRTTIKEILRRHNIPPAPERGHTPWRTFLNHYKDQILACDFFTVETLFLQTIYVLFFIEIGTRRVHIVGCTDHPDSAWVTQQARNLIWNLQERDKPIRFLIHDRDSKFCRSFDRVFESEGCEIVVTPIQAPNANGYASYCTSCARFGANSDSGNRRRSDSFLP
jgi:putative transposase